MNKWGHYPLVLTLQMQERNMGVGVVSVSLVVRLSWFEDADATIFSKVMRLTGANCVTHCMSPTD